MKLIDLTLTMKDGMEVYPGDPEVKISSFADFPEQPCRLAKLSFGSHTGTHMDAPAHMVRMGATLDEIEPEHFCGMARVFPGDTDFGCVDLTGLDFVILNFDWAKHRGSGDFYTDYPAMTQRNAAILSISGLKGVGMDTPSVDNPSTGLDNHHILLSSGHVLIENLINLQQLGDQPFRLISLPMKWKNADGAPCRAVAVAEE